MRARSSNLRSPGRIGGGGAGNGVVRYPPFMRDPGGGIGVRGAESLSRNRIRPTEAPPRMTRNPGVKFREGSASLVDTFRRNVPSGVALLPDVNLAARTCDMTEDDSASFGSTGHTAQREAARQAISAEPRPDTPARKTPPTTHNISEVSHG